MGKNKQVQFGSSSATYYWLHSLDFSQSIANRFNRFYPLLQVEMQDIRETGAPSGGSQPDDVQTMSPSTGGEDRRSVADQATCSTETANNVPVALKREPGLEFAVPESNISATPIAGGPNGMAEGADRADGKDDKMAPQLVAAKAETTTGSPQATATSVPAPLVGKLDGQIKINENLKVGIS